MKIILFIFAPLFNKYDNIKNMLSYQHAYHAGNHADILKHFVVTFVINSLNKKDKPYTFFDTHAGSGLYDLLDNRNLKTGEGEKGIVSFIQKVQLSENSAVLDTEEFECLKKYIQLIKKYTDKNLYPGSPQIEKEFLRGQDSLILSELHPQEIENLKDNMSGKSSLSKIVNKSTDNPVIQVHNRSGWEMIKALTPPKTKRGAVLIDPSYEETDDYINAAETIISINKKWSNGIILLWYPLIAHRQSQIENMIERITESVKLNNENIEINDFRLCVNTIDSHKEETLEQNAEDKALNKNPPRLYGSGMLVINTPWKLAEAADKVIPYCQQLLKV